MVDGKICNQTLHVKIKSFTKYLLELWACSKRYLVKDLSLSSKVVKW